MFFKLLVIYLFSTFFVFPMAFDLDFLVDFSSNRLREKMETTTTARSETMKEEKGSKENEENQEDKSLLKETVNSETGKENELLSSIRNKRKFMKDFNIKSLLKQKKVIRKKHAPNVKMKLHEVFNNEENHHDAASKEDFMNQDYSNLVDIDFNKLTSNRKMPNIYIGCKEIKDAGSKCSEDIFVNGRKTVKGLNVNEGTGKIVNGVIEVNNDNSKSVKLNALLPINAVIRKFRTSEIEG